MPYSTVFQTVYQPPGVSPRFARNTPKNRGLTPNVIYFRPIRVSGSALAAGFCRENVPCDTGG